MRVPASEGRAWEKVLTYARRIYKETQDAGSAQDAMNILTIAHEMHAQVKSGVHRNGRRRRNPTLALVGAANPPKKFLGFVDRIEYDRAVGKHRGGHFHDVSTQDAKLYGLADGSLLITRR